LRGTSRLRSITGNSLDNFLDFSQTLDTSGQRKFAAAELASEYESSKFQAAESYLNLERQARDAYWNLALTQAQTRIAIVGYQDSQLAVDQTISQDSLGGGDKVDTLWSTIDSANARRTLMEARAAEREALADLNSLLGRDTGAPIRLAADLLAPEMTAGNVDPSGVELPDLNVVGDLALKNRPIVKFADEQVRKAGYGINVAKAEAYPNLNVDYLKSLQRGSTDAYVLTLNMPLIDWGSVRQSVRSAGDRRTVAEATRLLTQQKTVLQAVKAHAELKAALQEVKVYANEIVAPATSLLEIARNNYKPGSSSLLPLIDAIATMRNAHLGYVNTIVKVYRAQSALWTATGHPLPNFEG
jgi:outer membrane protein TolC